MTLIIERTAHCIAERVQVVVTELIREMYPRSDVTSDLAACLHPNGRHPVEGWHHRIEAAIGECLIFAQQTSQTEQEQAK